jgi:drug/metabolite transporter (DMT)-like permease
MKRILTIIGIVLLLVGILWILQGYNVIGGSVMSGQMIWALLGLIAGIVGTILLFVAYRPRTRP